MKNTFRISMSSKEYTFPVVFIVRSCWPPLNPQAAGSSIVDCLQTAHSVYSQLLSISGGLLHLKPEGAQCCGDNRNLTEKNI
jgi:hypothetical protein